MQSTDVAGLEARSRTLLREVGEALRDLASDLECAAEIGGPDGIDLLKRIATDLKINHETLLLLANVQANLGRLRPRLN